MSKSDPINLFGRIQLSKLTVPLWLRTVIAVLAILAASFLLLSPAQANAAANAQPSDCPAWEATQSYTTGLCVSDQGNTWCALWWNQNSTSRWKKIQGQSQMRFLQNPDTGWDFPIARQEEADVGGHFWHDEIV